MSAAEAPVCTAALLLLHSAALLLHPQLSPLAAVTQTAAGKAQKPLLVRRLARRAVAAAAAVDLRCSAAVGLALFAAKWSGGPEGVTSRWPLLVAVPTAGVSGRDRARGCRLQHCHQQLNTHSSVKVPRKTASATRNASATSGTLCTRTMSAPCATAATQAAAVPRSR